LATCDWTSSSFSLSDSASWPTTSRSFCNRIVNACCQVREREKPNKNIRKRVRKSSGPNKQTTKKWRKTRKKWPRHIFCSCNRWLISSSGFFYFFI
jgi:hypothetical protein